MARLQGRIAAHVVFAKPAGTPAGWEKTDLWHSAAAIPGATLMADEGQAEARHEG